MFIVVAAGEMSGLRRRAVFIVSHGKTFAPRRRAMFKRRMGLFRANL